MSIVVLGAYSKFLISALKRVQDELDIKPAYWSAPPGRLEEIRGQFPSAVVQSVFDLTRADVSAFCKACGIDSPSYRHLSKEFMESYSYEREYVFHNLLHRSDPGGAFTHEEIRDTLNNYFLIAQNLLDKYQPKLVYMDAMPHAMYDLAIYLLAKRRNIKIVMMKGTHIPEIGYIASSIDDSLMDSHYYTEAQAGAVERSAAIDTALSPGSSLFYMEKSKYGRDVSEMCWAVVGALRSYVSEKLSDHANGQVAGYEKAPRYLQAERVGRFGIVKHAFASVCYERLYKRLAESSLAKLEAVTNYVYVPLSLQHEATTMPAAGMMYDQKNYIRLLASLLPRSVAIIVKENPKQFSINTGILNRSKRFYKDLSDMGVLFAGLDHSSADLTKNAMCTVVTTGTAGFESVYKYNKPTLAFSKNWYIDMPGVTYAYSLEDVISFVDKLVKKEILINEDDVESYILKIKEKSIYIYQNWFYVERNGWDYGHMERNLYAVFRHELASSV